jgi:CMP-N-acetylneuraminic acid synthetase
MLPVVLHALEQLAECDVLVLLQPTSPLRRADHVDAAVRLLERSGADGVVSVIQVPHPFAPESLMRLEDGRLVPLQADAPVLRQEKDQVLARNGPAVLAVRTAGLGERGLYGGDLRAYVMSAEDSVDVDGPFELTLAEMLLARR